ncbi:MAG: 2OG-Fe(II) oxygenase [Rhizobacter sp.]
MLTRTHTVSRPWEPLPSEAGFCLVVPGFLSPEECGKHIQASETRGFAGAASHYPPSYRNNDRQVVDDAALARGMAERMAAHVPGVLEIEGARWFFDGINERFRFCRYRPGQQFNIHQDGVHHRGTGFRSRLTFMVYLTDGDDFCGGDTVFYSAGPAGDASGAPAREIGRVRPRAGSLILFDHALWHAGAVVTHGVKHILRSDVMYRREGEARSMGGAFTPGHEGYIWTMARLDEHTLASGARDGLIRLWQPDGTAIGQLAGHRQSVLGLAALPGGSLASISRDGSLRLWDMVARRCTRAIEAHQGSGLCVTALPDGRLATGGADGKVCLWQADGSPITALAGHTGWVWAIVALSDGRLASASEDGTLRVWDLASGRCIEVLQAGMPLRDVVAVNGEQLVCGGIDGRVITWAWTANGWTQVNTWPAHRAAVRRLRLIGGGLLASAGEDNRVCIWRVVDQALVAEACHDNFATDVLPVPGGYLSCAYDGRIVSHALPAQPS